MKKVLSALFAAALVFLVVTQTFRTSHEITFLKDGKTYTTRVTDWSIPNVFAYSAYFDWDTSTTPSVPAIGKEVDLQVHRSKHKTYFSLCNSPCQKKANSEYITATVVAVKKVST